MSDFPGLRARRRWRLPVELFVDHAIAPSSLGILLSSSGSCMVLAGGVQSVIDIRRIVIILSLEFEEIFDSVGESRCEVYCDTRDTHMTES